MMEVHLHVAEVTCSLLPRNDPDRRHFEVSVQWRGGDRYAVVLTSIRSCLSRTGRWDLEPPNSERTEEFHRTHRFSLAEAIQRAEAAARAMEPEVRARLDRRAGHGPPAAPSR